MDLVAVIIAVICASWQINSANKSGGSGHPCLVLRFIVKGCEMILFVITCAVGEIVIIHLMNDSPKPNLSNVINKKV